jgi:hypothetical protein
MGIKIGGDAKGLFRDRRFPHPGQGEHSRFFPFIAIADKVPVSPVANGMIGIDHTAFIFFFGERPVFKGYRIKGLQG